MKFNVNTKFYNKMNILAKVCLFVGLWLVDLSMKLSGLEEN